MANNPNLYNAVIAGATGASQQRWLTDPVSANYTSFQSAIVALATAVDDAIAPVGGDVSTAAAALMQSIVQGVFADRFVQSAQQASYDSIVGPIVALWTELSEALDPSGGGVIGGLSTFVWVDPAAETEEEEQDGSAVNPYSTIAQAVTYLVSVGGGTVALIDGDYTDASAATIAGAEDEVYTYLGYGNAQNVEAPIVTGQCDVHFVNLPSLGAVSNNGDGGGFIFKDTVVAEIDAADCAVELSHGTVTGILTAVSLNTDNDSFIGGNITITGDINAEDTQFQGAILQCNSLGAYESLFVAPITTTGAVTFEWCEAAATINASDIFIVGGEFQQDLTATGSFSARQAIFLTDGAVNVACGSANMQDCQLGGNITADSDITLDEKSWGFILSAGGTITPGTTLNINDLPSAGSQIGYLPAGGNSQVIEILPAGHAPGVYDVAGAVVVRTAAGAGSINPTFSFDAPTFNATSITGGAQTITATGAILSSSRPIVSDGTAAITCQFAPSGITGNPVVDLYCSARLNAPLG